MPLAPRKPCAAPGCGELVCGTQRHCAKHTKQAADRKAKSRKVSKSYQSLYDWSWRKYRTRFLSEHPLCRICSQEGYLAAATVVDHIRPHRGDRQVFWDTSNHQALCKRHHDAKTAREDGGFGNRRH